MTTSSIWVLTEEYNDYDQHGEYFVHAWDHKPSRQELIECGVQRSRPKMNDYVSYVLNGGGRLVDSIYYDDQWYLLKEIK
jgi:hypothetical protein